MDQESVLTSYIKTSEDKIDKEFSLAEPLNPNKRLRADKGSSLQDFMKMVGTLIELTMPDVEFCPDEGKIMSLDAVKTFNKPMINYKVIERKTDLELKPRFRQNFNINENENAEIWGQKFKCLVQFNIFASVYKEAEQVMEKFEEIIFSYTGFLKRNGVREILFKEHKTDSHLDTLRETLSIRSLIYYVEIEKLTVILKEKIKEIEVLAQKRKDEEE